MSREGSKTGAKPERGPLGTYVALAQTLMSSVILREVVVAGVLVKALIGSRATTLCCSRQWYRRYHTEVGLLVHDQTQMTGVENTPIFVDGGTTRVPLERKEATMTVFFLLVPTRIEQDAILGMDLLQRLGVMIDTNAGVAEPTVLVSHIQSLETWRIPARKSMVFSIRDPFLGKKMSYLNPVISYPQL